MLNALQVKLAVEKHRISGESTASRRGANENQASEDGEVFGLRFLLSRHLLWMQSGLWAEEDTGPAVGPGALR